MSAPWWPTTWDKLAPGDEIQAPDGSAGEVLGALIIAEGGEWQIRHPERGIVWTPHDPGDPVSARRPDRAGPDVNAEATLGRLRMAFGEVEVLQRDDTGPVDGPRWLRCGQRGKCACR
jgi:hypothetical protein